MFINGENYPIQIQTNGPAPEVWLDGRKIGAVIGCQGEPDPILCITDAQAREKIGQFVTQNDEQKASIMARYTSSIPSWTKPGASVWDDPEFVDDQYPYACLLKNRIDDSNSDDIEETSRFGAN